MQDNKMQDFEYITVKCIEVKQPIGVFYLATIEWYDLNRIARADIRRIERGEGGNIESYLGIQRRLNNKRVKEIGKYVQNIDATFPTAVILHIKSFATINKDTEDEFEIHNVLFDKEKSEMRIRVDNDVANILDGQHRIEGLKAGLGSKHENSKKFQLNVSIFVDLDMDDQSMVFATVNKAQTKVNKSLVYDLFDYATSRSPQRTAHNVVRLLNDSKNGPFYKKVKILGTADDPLRETITQATLAESIIKYISNNPMLDRDILKRKKNLPKVIGPDLQKLIFRNLFIEEKDIIITDIIENFFIAVKSKWPEHWDNTILSKSTGIIALMKFLKPSYLHLVKKIGDEVSVDDFNSLFDLVDINGDNFVKENYLPGATGYNKLYKQLLEQTNLN